MGPITVSLIDFVRLPISASKKYRLVEQLIVTQVIAADGEAGHPAHGQIGKHRSAVS
jgi:hypothetical protein